MCVCRGRGRGERVLETTSDAVTAFHAWFSGVTLSSIPFDFRPSAFASHTVYRDETWINYVMPVFKLGSSKLKKNVLNRHIYTYQENQTPHLVNLILIDIVAYTFFFRHNEVNSFFFIYFFFCIYG